MSLPCLTMDGALQDVPISDIVYVELLKPKSEKLLFHTYEGDYIFCFKGTLETFFMVYKSRGFDDLDSCNVVNMKKIVSIDRTIWIAHFDNNLQTTISRRNKDKVKHIPDKS